MRGHPPAPSRRKAGATGARWRRVGLAVSLLCLGACGGAEPPPLERYEFGGDFTLTDHDGQAFRLADRRGQVLLLFFGFTACTDACPTTLSRLGQVMEALPSPGVETLFVSVDPKHDTPERLADFTAGYPFRLTGLTGDAPEIRQVVSQYAASFQASADGGVDHSLRIYLIDADGDVRFLFSHDDTVADMVRVVRRLL